MLNIGKLLLPLFISIIQTLYSITVIFCPLCHEYQIGVAHLERLRAYPELSH